MSRRRLRTTLAIACVAFPLVLHLLADTRRTLELETTGEHAGLTLFRDLGRGFYPPDAQRLEGRGPFVVQLPLEVRAFRAELQLPAPGASVRLTRVDGTELGSQPLPRPAPPSLWTWVLSGLATALLALLGGAWLARRPALSVEGVFTLEGAASVTAGWLLTIVSLERAAQFIDAWVIRFDNPPWWPISIVDPVSPGWPALLAAAGLIAAVAWASGRLQDRPVALAVLLAVASLGGNSLHGWEQAVVTPSSGPHSYWLDVKPTEPAREFLQHFNERQPTLHPHSRTHPPLAALLYAPFVRLGLPALASLCLGALAFGVSLLSLWRLQRSALPLFAALPAVQIYFVASLDAVICAAFLATLALALDDRPGRRWLCCLPLFLATQLTFASLFLVALLLWQAATARSRELLGALGLTALAIAALQPGFGFDWWESLRVASALENPQGFRLLAEPVNYLFTRLEGLAEIVLFLGPWVSALLIVALRGARLGSWGSRGLAVLIAMLLAGAFKTGETARACLFVLPGVVALISPLLAPPRARALIVAAFAQATLMQLWGDFFW